VSAMTSSMSIAMRFILFQAKPIRWDNLF
jgi:hypothetical protein